MFSSILRASPYDIEVDADGDCPTVIVAIAQCNEKNRIVSVVCELAKADVCKEPCWEFSFSIEVFALDGSIEPFRTQDRQIAVGYIPDEVRKRVMDVVCEALKALLDHTNCRLIYRVTKDRDPSEKGLKKHHLLTETLVNVGFSLLEDGTDPYSRRYWIMQRPD